MALTDTPEEREDSEEVADGRSASVTIRGEKRVFHAPTHPVTHNSMPPANNLQLDWVYPLMSYSLFEPFQDGWEFEFMLFI